MIVSALSNETFPLYRNLGNGLFADATYRTHIGAATLALSGWGLGAYDFDNDGRKDLLVGEYYQGRLRIYRNVGGKGQPKFEDYSIFKDGDRSGCIWAS